MAVRRAERVKREGWYQYITKKLGNGDFPEDVETTTSGSQVKVRSIGIGNRYLLSWVEINGDGMPYARVQLDKAGSPEKVFGVDLFEREVKFYSYDTGAIPEKAIRYFERLGARNAQSFVDDLIKGVWKLILDAEKERSSPDLEEWNNQYLHREFWLELRRKTGVSGDGRGICDNWCQEALKILKGYNFEDAFLQKAASLKGVVRNGLHYHEWLEADKNGRRYIADGTADQIDPRFADGFYGFLEEAPETLRPVYSKPDIQTD